MSRTTRRRAVRAIAPVAGLLAAGLLVWQGSYAAFSATSTSPGNSWTTGQVVLKNNTTGSANYQATGVAAFSVTKMAPSATAVSVPASTPPPGPVGTSRLSESCQVRSAAAVHRAMKCYVKDVPPDCSTGFTGGTVIYNARPLHALPTTYAAGVGAWAPTGAATEYAAYKISYVFNPGTAVADVQNKTVNADIVWEIDSV